MKWWFNDFNWSRFYPAGSVNESRLKNSNGQRIQLCWSSNASRICSHPDHLICPNALNGWGRWAVANETAITHMQPELLWYKTPLCSINNLFYTIRDMRAQTQEPLCIIDHHLELITQNGMNHSSKKTPFLPFFFLTFFHLPTLVQGPKRFVKHWNGFVLFWGGGSDESHLLWLAGRAMNHFYSTKISTSLSHCRCWLLSLCSFSPSANSRLSVSFLMQYY